MHAVWASLLLVVQLGTMTSVEAHDITCLHLHPQGVTYDTMAKTDFVKLCKAANKIKGTVPPCKEVSCADIQAADQCVVRSIKNKAGKWLSTMGCMEKKHQASYPKGTKKTKKELVYVCDNANCNEPKNATKFMKTLKALVKKTKKKKKKKKEEGMSTVTIVLIVLGSLFGVALLLGIVAAVVVVVRKKRAKKRELEAGKEELKDESTESEDDKEKEKEKEKETEPEKSEEEGAAAEEEATEGEGEATEGESEEEQTEEADGNEDGGGGEEDADEGEKEQEDAEAETEEEEE